MAGRAKKAEMVLPIWMRLRQEEVERGTGRTLSREKIVRTAIALADAGGLDEVSMRKVAAAVNSGTMSLYRYVPTKEDLFDLMLDAILGEFALADEPSGDWRADLAAVADQTRDLCRHHPWATNLLLGRPPLGPNLLRSAEFALAALDGRGLDIDTISRMTSVVRAYAGGFVSNELAEQEIQRRTGMTDWEWKTSLAPYVRKIVESGDFPMTTRYVIEANDSPDMDEEFRAGLSMVLDGIAAALPKRRKSNSR